MSEANMKSEEGLPPYFADYDEAYQEMLRQVRGTLAALPPRLQSWATEYMEQLAQARFTRIAALLPFWVGEMLGEIQPEITRSLGLANVWGWAYYRLQDWLVDGEADGAEAILYGIIFFNEYSQSFRSLLPHDELFWHGFSAAITAASEANAREGAHHFRDLAEIADSALGWQPDLLAERAAPLRVGAIAQLRLAGHLPNEPIYREMLEIICSYSVANQLADDDEDWLTDLRAGRLNTLSAAALRRLRAREAGGGGEPLSVERLAGYYLADDGLLNEMFQLKVRYLERASSLARVYGGRSLLAFLEEMRASLEVDHRRLLSQRRAFCALFMR